MNIHSMKIDQKLARPIKSDDLELYEHYYAAEARESFWAYRRFMDPTLKLGWFPYDMSMELQAFWEAFVAGRRPKMLIWAPPQHGKSRGLQDFMSWIAGKNPDLQTMYGSYSEDLGIKANRFLQRRFEEPRYKLTFPETKIGTDNVVTLAGRPQRNSFLIEFVGKKGNFNNVTVGGQVTGKGLDFGVVDDPIKGRSEAKSKVIRQKTWDWLTDDFFSRFSDLAALIMIMTRWDVDDPSGRWLERFPETQILKYPAEAVVRSSYRKIGDPLFPQFKSKEFIEERKRVMSTASFESLYQQNPIVVGGGMFPIDKFEIIKSFDRKDIKRSVRYWDKAGTAGGGAFTAGVLMHEMKSGGFIIEDCTRGQWKAFRRESIIKATAVNDNNLLERIETIVEREPGSGGKESAERTILMLKGFVAREDRVTGNKETRADPYSSQVQAGNVQLVYGNWVRAFLDEHEAFPGSKFKDQVDAAGGAFAALCTKKYNYDTTMQWANT